MINKYSSIPLYTQLKEMIISKIENGEYAENLKIPSEQEFCELYDISRPTVRQAIADLTNSGVLYKEKGKGTFVASSKSRVDIKNYSGFTDSILDSQLPGQRNILSAKTIQTSGCDRLKDIFNLPQGKEYDFAEIKFITTQNEQVLSLNKSYILLDSFPNIIEDVKGSKPSYDILRGKYPLIPAKTKSCLEVIYTEQEDARFIKVQPGQALIQIENVLYSKSGQVVEFIVSKFRADKCKFLYENVKSSIL